MLPGCVFGEIELISIRAGNPTAEVVDPESIKWVFESPPAHCTPVYPNGRGNWLKPNKGGCSNHLVGTDGENHVSCSYGPGTGCGMETPSC